jgi:hypothetical protein
VKKLLLLLAALALAALLLGGWVDGYRHAAILPLLLQWPAALWSRRRRPGPSTVDGHKAL